MDKFRSIWNSWSFCGWKRVPVRYGLPRTGSVEDIDSLREATARVVGLIVSEGRKEEH
ncbi:hypothetical protein H1164_09085 [Thermoactinomyces daqus]|uniref:Uncharacterized protein n=1 Tax=Thermoactinomyces daqus TaxID=1329516 RepID=A0A7W1XAD4_9BACL|nr:hypothetical protein [Thermoactinomyces daqus]MBA4543055.1 hypothetical protein [Thermoactinomyces daqus]